MRDQGGCHNPSEDHFEDTLEMVAIGSGGATTNSGSPNLEARHAAQMVQ